MAPLKRANTCVLGLMLALGCSGETENAPPAEAPPDGIGVAGGDPTGGLADGKADRSEGGDLTFEFRSEADGEYVKVDHAAVPFLSTGPLQRSNAYNDLAPGVASLLRAGTTTTVLLELLRGLNRWNDVINDDLKDMGRRAAPEELPEDEVGFEPCAGELPFLNPFDDMDGELTASLPCVLHAVEPTGDRLLDIVWPDKLTIDLRHPPGYPNGRVLHENITDIFFAIAFIKQDLRSLTGVFRSRGNCNGEPCDRSALANIPMNPLNDVPFRDDFPYIAPAHR